MTKLMDQLKQSASRARKSVLQGRRELNARSSGALTRFRITPPASNPSSAQDDDWLPLSGWRVRGCQQS